MVKAGGTVKTFPKTSLFSTACRVVVVVFLQAARLVWIFEGEGGRNFGKNDSEISENKPKHVHAGVFLAFFFFLVLKCWGMKSAARTARLALCMWSRWVPGDTSDLAGTRAVSPLPLVWDSTSEHDPAAGGPGCGTGREHWVLVLGCLPRAGAAHLPFWALVLSFPLLFMAKNV